MAWVLGGMLKGLHERQEPRAALKGNVYRAANDMGEALPRYWPAALDRFEASDFARELLGTRLHQLYGLVKRHELDEFNRQPTPHEFSLYLPAL
jgi:glutamine synthetase